MFHFDSFSHSMIYAPHPFVQGPHPSVHGSHLSVPTAHPPSTLPSLLSSLLSLSSFPIGSISSTNRKFQQVKSITFLSSINMHNTHQYHFLAMSFTLPTLTPMLPIPWSRFAFPLPSLFSPFVSN